MEKFDNLVHKYKNYARHRFLRRRLRNSDFCIIANNCWGSRIYKELRLPYNTPFVGLFLFSPDYIRILSNLQWYLDHKIHFVTQSRYPQANKQMKEKKYPIGLLGEDVELHFLHYSSSEEAEQKWEARKRRMNFGNLFVAYSDRDLFEDQHLLEYENLNYEHKVFFCADPKYKTPSSVWLPEFVDQPYVGDLYTEPYFVYRHFDVIDWLNKGTGRLTPCTRFIYKVLEVK